MARTRAITGVTITTQRQVLDIFEGSHLTGLKYYDKTVGGEVTIDGTVRVIVANTVRNSTIPSNCPPEPYVQKYVTPTMLIVDISNVFDADLVRINISDIIDIKSVDGKDSPEVIIDDAISNIEGADVVETGDNEYLVTTSTGSIADSGLFESIASIKNFESMTITNGDSSFEYVADGDMEAFKTSVDGLIPKENGSGTVTLTLIVNIGS